MISRRRSLNHADCRLTVTSSQGGDRKLHTLILLLCTNEQWQSGTDFILNCTLHYTHTHTHKWPNIMQKLVKDSQTISILLWNIRFHSRSIYNSPPVRILSHISNIKPSNLPFLFRMKLQYRCMHFSTCHMNGQSYFLFISSAVHYVLRSTEHEALCYAVFDKIPSRPPSCLAKLFSKPYYNNTQLIWRLKLDTLEGATPKVLQLQHGCLMSDDFMK